MDDGRLHADAIAMTDAMAVAFDLRHFAKKHQANKLKACHS